MVERAKIRLPQAVASRDVAARNCNERRPGTILSFRFENSSWLRKGDNQIKSAPPWRELREGQPSLQAVTAGMPRPKSDVRVRRRSLALNANSREIMPSIDREIELSTLCASTKSAASFVLSALARSLQTCWHGPSGGALFRDKENDP